MLGTNSESTAKRIFTVVFSCFSLNPQLDVFLFIAQYNYCVILFLAVEKVDAPDVFPGNRDLGVPAPTVENVRLSAGLVQNVWCILDIQYFGCNAALSVDKDGVIGIGILGKRPGSAAKQAKRGQTGNAIRFHKNSFCILGDGDTLLQHQ